MSKDNHNPDDEKIEIPVSDQNASGQSAAPPPPPTADARIAQLQAEVARLNDRLLRTTADYQNYQKRTARETADARDRARRDVLREVLTVVDDLERALEAGRLAQPAEAIIAGVRITHEHLLGLLSRHGVTPIEAVGRPFDPEIHEALMREPAGDVPPMTVTQEVARGYLMDGRPLRASRVVVAVAPEGEETD
ncbi:MAG: Protein GrpE [Phycisphaerae bacterium]|nr:Protein GrpE [Phycisphaerae bacterium]